MRKVKIEIEITLDDQNLVEEISWKSDDPPSNGQQSKAKAFFLSLFDESTLQTLKIDLWSSKFEVGEMTRLTYYSLKAIGESYFKATKNSRLANDIARFSQYFGEESGMIQSRK